MPKKKNPEVFYGCPDCGSALLREYESTADSWEVTISAEDGHLEVGTPKWIRDNGYEEELLGCARCDAELETDDLVPVSPAEVEKAAKKLSQLRDSVPNSWEKKIKKPALCPHCDSKRIIVEVRREWTLAAIYSDFGEGAYPGNHDHWPDSPWGIDIEVLACASCRAELSNVDLKTS